MSETVILCEGYHDRAFWKGWLEFLQCKNLFISGKIIKDPFGDDVKGGNFAFHSQSGRFIRVRPCGGRDGVLHAARIRLGQRSSKALTRLVINVDPDNLQGQVSATTGLRAQDVHNRVKTVDPSATISGDVILLDGGATEVNLVRWEANDPAQTRGLPDEQTLERLVCAALVEAYPQRGENVQTWLDGRHEPPPTGVKDFSWSYMAGWYSDHGCESFYSNLWQDVRVRGELETRLRVTGAWQTVETLARS